jgi:hypothetical protein
VILSLIALYTVVVAVSKSKTQNQVHPNVVEVNTGESKASMLRLFLQPLLLYTGAYRLVRKEGLSLISMKTCIIIEFLGHSLPSLAIVIYNIVQLQSSEALQYLKVILCCLNIVDAGVLLFMVNHVKSQQSITQTIFKKNRSITK